MPRAPRLSSLRLDDTGDELLKRRAEPLISQLKQRRLWQGANRIADAREREINIKQPLRQEERLPFCQACSLDAAQHEPGEIVQCYRVR